MSLRGAAINPKGRRVAAYRAGPSLSTAFSSASTLVLRELIASLFSVWSSWRIYVSLSEISPYFVPSKSKFSWVFPENSLNSFR